jgi:hypothetical protein
VLFGERNRLEACDHLVHVLRITFCSGNHFVRVVDRLSNGDRPLLAERRHRIVGRRLAIRQAVFAWVGTQCQTSDSSGHRPGIHCGGRTLLLCVCSRGGEPCFLPESAAQHTITITLGAGVHRAAPAVPIWLVGLGPPMVARAQVTNAGRATIASRRKPSVESASFILERYAYPS